MRGARRLLLACLLPACSLIGVERAPPWVEPDTRFICTDTYWVPAADAAAVAALLASSIWIGKKIDDACDRGDTEECDPQAGIAIVMPLLVAVPYGVSAEIGRTRVRRCREAKSWQRATPRPPLAGHNGAACVPVFGRSEGRCDAGYCVLGRCQAEIPPAKLRLFCAEPIARWRATRDPARRTDLLAALPPACRPLAR